ncbi:PREDICTED: vacuolar ATPase assembly integral membrane protein VMA21 homolog [Nicrophorus vespilloides]|uniref:Vacuolar ATPase assembly integral membrane protein VMA21 homolog n=1 Tax=Nicrophorus vespilloides TaxID=110193 RepID=A0ABM1MT59_NICVS|nr:PREDICTED: vacuolar ATPase assembly integral membrane protein VMA21 homolog [Nicrophorus vespilloides]
MSTSSLSIFKTVLYYSVFIIIAPISTFFFTKIVFFEKLLGTSSVASNVWSAIASIIVLHIALGMYIMRAYSDANKVKSDKEDKVD